MLKIWHVAKRELRETAKTKFFLFSFFFTPLLIFGIMALTRFTTEKAVNGPRPPKTIAVVDLSGELQADLERAFAEHNALHPDRPIHVEAMNELDVDSADAAVERVKADVRADRCDGALVVGQTVTGGSGESVFYLKTRSMGDVEFVNVVKSLHQDAVVNFRFRAHHLSADLVETLSRTAPVTPVDVTAENEQRGAQMGRIFVPFFFVFLMFMGIFGTSQGMLTSVIEEKNSRVVEVLLSAMDPFQLMAGKILGLAALGFAVMCAWGSLAFVAAAYNQMGDLLTASGVGYFLVYFVLGFLLFSSLFAAVGAMCNSVKEAQTMMMPLMIVVIVPLMLWPYIANFPNGKVAVLLSFLPMTSPMIMILRIASVPELSRFQILASIAVLVASIPVLMWFAAKIFRTGILMYGKPPSFGEIWRWMRIG